jgi:methylamine---corrinoid protein Co-methyltransferase
MKNHGRLMDVIDRAYDGPPCDERDFDMQFIADGVARVVKEHGIKFDRDKIIQQDDEMADRVWEAGLEFLVGCGVFNTSTGRRMVFSRQEIEDALLSAPSEAVIGEGDDARQEIYRRIEDPRPPMMIGGPIGTPLSEDMYVPLMQSYIQEPLIDTTTSGTLATTYGRAPRTRSALEVVAAWQEVEFIQAAARRAGRPGMGFGAVQMAISEVGHLTAINRGGYRSCDWHMIAMYSELKTNNELLIKTAHSINANGNIQAFYNPILGGLGGGEEGMAVLVVAGFAAMQMLYMAATHSTGPVTPSIAGNTVPQVIRATSAANCAVSRNSHLMFDMVNSPVCGPVTPELLYECIASATTGTVTGASRLLGVRSTTGIYENHCTGLEGRFNSEVGHAATRLSREEADEIVKKAVAKYQAVLSNAPKGKPFQEAYNPVTVRPTDEWRAIYDQVKEQAAAWGLDFSWRPPTATLGI